MFCRGTGRAFRTFRFGLLVAIAVFLAAAAAPGNADGQSRFRPGAAGAGDPYFPLDGNGGYDTKHYLLDVRYDPATDVLEGVATIRARATQNLSRFNLDFDGLTVSRSRSTGARRAGREMALSSSSGRARACATAVCSASRFAIGAHRSRS